MANKKEILELYKEEGETPLQCLNRYRAENPVYQNVTMTYAGRLDPMAEGLLLVLAGNINEDEKKKLMSLPKTYEFEVVWGVVTDSYDILGLTTVTAKSPEQKVIEIEAQKIIGKKMQKYPAYSSKPVNGKPLFSIARSGRLNEIEVPEKEVEVYSLNVLSHKKITGHKLLELVHERVYKVKGDFRQEDIIQRWTDELAGKESVVFVLTKIEVQVSSGTYIRGIAHDLGERLQCGACAYSIRRIKIGDHTV